MSIKISPNETSKSNVSYEFLIKDCRNKLKLTQGDLAQILEVTQATVARWERGDDVSTEAKNQIDKLSVMIKNESDNIWLKEVLYSNGGLLAISSALKISELNAEKDLISVSFRSAQSLRDFLSNHTRSFDSNIEEINMSRSEQAAYRLSTHGYKEIKFDFKYDPQNRFLVIENEKDNKHVFSLDLIHQTLLKLYEDFQFNEFPLANNVQKLGNNTEKLGLGSILHKLNGKDISNAQASSYLGPILENIGLLEWNGAMKGIKWRLAKEVPNKDDLASLLTVV